MKDFEIDQYNNGMAYLRIPDFDNTGMVKTAFTTRMGGVSKGPYHSFNLGKKTSDSPLDVQQNYEIVMDTLKIQKLVSLDQIHSDRIIEIKKENLPMDQSQVTAGEGDALITNERGIAIMTVHADCVPIYFIDVKNKVIALAHSGWKGTLKNIGAKTFYKMQELYKSEANNIKTAVGPGIGYCCFETGEDVYERLKAQYHYMDDYSRKVENHKYFINLKGLIKKQLEKIGFKDIIISKDCTMCRRELFFSHRRDKGITGRMAAIIQLI